MSDALLRRSEASAVRWADFERAEDGSGRLTVRRSKSDQEGRGAVLYIGIETAKAIAAIRPDATDQDAPIFGLSPSQIHRVIRKRAAAAGIEDASSHGLRVGTAQELAIAGAGTAAIQQSGRWADPKMVARYTAKIAAGQSAVARYRYGR